MTDRTQGPPVAVWIRYCPGCHRVWHGQTPPRKYHWMQGDRCDVSPLYLRYARDLGDGRDPWTA